MHSFNLAIIIIIWNLCIYVCSNFTYIKELNEVWLKMRRILLVSLNMTIIIHKQWQPLGSLIRSVIWGLYDIRFALQEMFFIRTGILSFLKWKWGCRWGYKVFKFLFCLVGFLRFVFLFFWVWGWDWIDIHVLNNFINKHLNESSSVNSYSHGIQYLLKHFSRIVGKDSFPPHPVLFSLL